MLYLFVKLVNKYLSAYHVPGAVLVLTQGNSRQQEKVLAPVEQVFAGGRGWEGVRK